MAAAASKPGAAKGAGASARPSKENQQNGLAGTGKHQPQFQIKRKQAQKVGQLPPKGKQQQQQQQQQQQKPRVPPKGRQQQQKHPQQLQQPQQEQQEQHQQEQQLAGLEGKAPEETSNSVQPATQEQAGSGLVARRHARVGCSYLGHLSLSHAVTMVSKRVAAGSHYWKVDRFR